MLQWKHGKALLPTFEEHKLPLAVLVHGVDLGWQAFPEVIDLHGVTRHHWVVPHPPEPLILEDNMRCSSSYSSSPSSSLSWLQSWLAADLLHLKHKEFLSEDCQGVEASIADVGFGVGVGRLGALRRAVRSDVAVVFTGVRGRVEARWGDRGWRPGRLRRSIRWACKQFFVFYNCVFFFPKIVTTFISAFRCFFSSFLFPVELTHVALKTPAGLVSGLTADKWCLLHQAQLTAAAAFVIMTSLLEGFRKLCIFATIDLMGRPLERVTCEEGGQLP